MAECNKCIYSSDNNGTNDMCFTYRESLGIEGHCDGPNSSGFEEVSCDNCECDYANNGKSMLCYSYREETFGFAAAGCSNHEKWSYYRDDNDDDNDDENCDDNDDENCVQCKFCIINNGKGMKCREYRISLGLYSSCIDNDEFRIKEGVECSTCKHNGTGAPACSNCEYYKSWEAKFDLSQCEDCAHGNGENSIICTTQNYRRDNSITEPCDKFELPSENDCEDCVYYWTFDSCYGYRKRNSLFECTNKNKFEQVDKTCETCEHDMVHDETGNHCVEDCGMNDYESWTPIKTNVMNCYSCAFATKNNVDSVPCYEYRESKGLEECDGAEKWLSEDDDIVLDCTKCKDHILNNSTGRDCEAHLELMGEADCHEFDEFELAENKRCDNCKHGQEMGEGCTKSACGSDYEPWEPYVRCITCKYHITNNEDGTHCEEYMGDHEINMCMQFDEYEEYVSPPEPYAFVHKSEQKCKDCTSHSDNNRSGLPCGKNRISLDSCWSGEKFIKNLRKCDKCKHGFLNSGTYCTQTGCEAPENSRWERYRTIEEQKDNPPEEQKPEPLSCHTCKHYHDNNGGKQCHQFIECGNHTLFEPLEKECENCGHSSDNNGSGLLCRSHRKLIKEFDESCTNFIKWISIDRMLQGKEEEGELDHPTPSYKLKAAWEDIAPEELEVDMDEWNNSFFPDTAKKSLDIEEELSNNQNIETNKNDFNINYNEKGDLNMTQTVKERTMVKATEAGKTAARISSGKLADKALKEALAKVFPNTDLTNPVVTGILALVANIGIDNTRFKDSEKAQFVLQGMLDNAAISGIEATGIMMIIEGFIESILAKLPEMPGKETKPEFLKEDKEQE